jgi:hypothetical protein
LKLSGGDHCRFKRSTRKKRPGTRDNNNNNNIIIIIIIIILNTGYEENIIKTNISHLLYMDNLKLLGKPDEYLQKQLQTAKTVSGDIHMEFVLHKCAKLYSRKAFFPRRI